MTVLVMRLNCSGSDPSRPHFQACDTPGQSATIIPKKLKPQTYLSYCLTIQGLGSCLIQSDPAINEYH